MIPYRTESVHLFFMLMNTATKKRGFLVGTVQGSGFRV